jgi:hypothetical protein
LNFILLIIGGPCGILDQQLQPPHIHLPNLIIIILVILLNIIIKLLIKRKNEDHPTKAGNGTLSATLAVQKIINSL